jgi:hypothetical protein
VTLTPVGPTAFCRFTYAAYGLGIESAIELPGLTTAPGPADVAILTGSVRRPTGVSEVKAGLADVTAREAYLFWPALAMVVRDGREIVVDPAPETEARTIGSFVTGPGFGVLLHQRGFLTLHGSAIALRGGAVAFLGAPGWGKSTMAAALQARGHDLVADDVVAVTGLGGEVPLAVPAFPQVKLWPDALAWLGEDAERLPRVHEALEKRARPAPGFVRQPLPLRCIYVLADAERLAVEVLQGHVAVFELVQHSYIAPAVRLLGSATHLAQCARLATSVAVRRLCRPRSLADLQAVAALVEGDVGRVAA